MLTLEEKRDLLSKCGFPTELMDQMIAFNAQGLVPMGSLRRVAESQSLDIPDWAQWWLQQLLGQRRVEDDTALPLLCQSFRSLTFPVASGVCDTQAYRASVCGLTLQKLDAPPVELSAGVILEVRQSEAGPVLVITAKDRMGFEHLLRCLGRRNRPDVIPSSWGAMFLKDVPNAARKADGAGLAKDPVILLSTGYYAGILPEVLPMPPEKWQTLSVGLRRVHELTHFILLRWRGGLSKGLTEEVLADAEAVIEAGFSGDEGRILLLRLLGLDTAGAPFGNARFVTYLPASLPDTAQSSIAKLIVKACDNLMSDPWRSRPRLQRLKLAASLSLEDLAHKELEPWLQQLDADLP